MTEVVEDESRKPASRRVADALRLQIKSGQYAAGDPLPTYRRLAADHDVAVNTAMAAVRQLRDEGLVVQRPNAGAVVRGTADMPDPAEELKSVRASLTDLRADLHVTGSALTSIEARLGELAERLGALER